MCDCDVLICVWCCVGYTLLCVIVMPCVSYLVLIDTLQWYGMTHKALQSCILRTRYYTQHITMIMYDTQHITMIRYDTQGITIMHPENKVLHTAHYNDNVWHTGHCNDMALNTTHCNDTVWHTGHDNDASKSLSIDNKTPQPTSEIQIRTSQSHI